MSQFSIIKKSDIDKARRFDAEYFKPEYLYTLELLNKISSKPLSYFIKDGYRVVYENTEILSDEEAKHRKTVNFLQANNIYGYVISNDVGKVDYSYWERYPKGRIRRGELLIEVKGNTEKVAIVPDDFPLNTLVSGSLFKLLPQNISPEFLLIWLTTKYGKGLKDRLRRNLAVHFIGKNDLYDIPVPVLPISSQQQIETLVKQAYEHQNQSKQLYREAEQLLLEELGLLDYRPKHRLTFTTTKKQVDEARRFDAEYFQPKYEEVIRKIKEYPGGYDLVKNAIKIKDKNFKPQETTIYKYVALSDIGSEGYIQSFIEAKGNELPSRARRKIEKNDVIISSIEGSLQACALVEAPYHNALCSTGFYVLSSQILNPETLLVLFKSNPVQMQLKKGCSGTILTALQKDELEKILIPLIRPELQEEIAQKIRQSFALRRQSKSLLEKAKKCVEEEIEKAAFKNE